MAEVDKVEKVFKEWDADGNGTINGRELQAVLEALYEGGAFQDKTVADAKADAGEFLLKLDKDQDQRISFEEFKNVLCKGS